MNSTTSAELLSCQYSPDFFASGPGGPRGSVVWSHAREQGTVPPDGWWEPFPTGREEQRQYSGKQLTEEARCRRSRPEKQAAGLLLRIWPNRLLKITIVDQEGLAVPRQSKRLGVG